MVLPLMEVAQHNFQQLLYLQLYSSALPLAV